eukprot:TRINITY_DN1512_c0_g1_i1.p1 TRINITY_DN1512_c0_g1~~TRINITY_DN1512_c0_g1_i1.p1  ORF type:complete len:146 (+),score=12.47 TRINITY_DN1512_c0_g1_i1:214-651(+)
MVFESLALSTCVPAYTMLCGRQDSQQTRSPSHGLAAAGGTTASPLSAHVCMDSDVAALDDGSRHVHAQVALSSEKGTVEERHHASKLSRRDRSPVVLADRSDPKELGVHDLVVLFNVDKDSRMQQKAKLEGLSDIHGMSVCCVLA